MNYRKYIITIFFIGFTFIAKANSKGSLFIIGGGERTPELVNQLVETANLQPNDYIVILPMATGVPEESIAYFSSQISKVCNNKIASFNFNKAQADEHQSWIDSVKNARLIYITGGDQNKFMNIVKDTKLFTALHAAYNNGATISGTSAGAAIMSEIMITGSEKEKDNKFSEIKNNNILTSTGMGFINTAIIDQHFIKRSRFNRLISVLADHPKKMVIGIDESTAIIVTGNKAKVVGESQVVVISKPKKLLFFNKNKVSFKDAKISLFSPNQTFKLK